MLGLLNLVAILALATDCLCAFFKVKRRSNQSIQSIVVLPKIVEILIVVVVVRCEMRSIGLNREINCLVDTLLMFVQRRLQLLLRLLFLFLLLFQCEVRCGETPP